MFHPKFQPLSYFLTLAILLWIHATKRPLPKFDSRHPRPYAPTLPTFPTLFTRLVKLIWTAIAWLNCSRTEPQIFPMKTFEIFRTCSRWSLPNLFQQAKRIFKVGKLVKCCSNWCYFYVFMIISMHFAWLEDSEVVAPKASMEKLFLKIS